MCDAILTLVFIFLAFIVSYTVVNIIRIFKQKRKKPICVTCLHCMSYSESLTPSGAIWNIKCNCGLGTGDSHVLNCSRYELDPDTFM